MHARPCMHDHACRGCHSPSAFDSAFLIRTRSSRSVRWPLLVRIRGLGRGLHGDVEPHLAAPRPRLHQPRLWRRQPGSHGRVHLPRPVHPRKVREPPVSLSHTQHTHTVYTHIYVSQASRRSLQVSQPTSQPNHSCHTHASPPLPSSLVAAPNKSVDLVFLDTATAGSTGYAVESLVRR
jgi:hypothetical protein